MHDNNDDNDDSAEADNDVVENHLFGSVRPTQSPDTPLTSLEIYIKIYTYWNLVCMYQEILLAPTSSYWHLGPVMSTAGHI